MGGRARPWEASEDAANNASEGRELRAPRRARWARSAWGEQLATRASQTHFMYTCHTNTYHTHTQFRPSYCTTRGTAWGRAPWAGVYLAVPPGHAGFPELG